MALLFLWRKTRRKRKKFLAVGGGFFFQKNIIKYKKSAENFSAHEFSPMMMEFWICTRRGTGQKVRRNDRLATDFGRVGDFFCRCGVYRGGVSGDWDQREQRRYAICACISN